MKKGFGCWLFATFCMITAQSVLALPPIVTWIRPTNGAVFTANSTIVLTARATGSNTTVAAVEFYANSNLVGTLPGSLTNLSAIYNFSWPNVQAGVYRLHAEAVNTLGERGVSGSVQITVNTNTPPPPTNAVPVVNWIRPTNGATFPPGSHIFMTALPIDADGSISFVDFFANSNLLGRGVWAPSSGFYNFMWSNAPSGSFRLHAEAVDNAGGRGASVPAQIVVATNEPPPPPTNNVPPVVTWIRPTNGAVLPAGSTVLLQARASDSDGLVTLVDFFANSNLLGSVIGLSTNNIYTFVWSNAPPGIFRLHAEAVDNAGDRAASVPVQILVATGSPPTIVSQPQSQTVNEGDTVTFSVTATGTSPLSYRWRRNNVIIPGAINPTLTLSNVTSTHAGTYSVIVTNLFGARISSNAVLTVISQPGSNSPPVVTLLSPSNGMTFPAGQPIILRAFATDPDGNMGFVDFFASTTRVARAFSSNALFSAVWTNAPLGNHLIRAIATDTLGAQAISAPASITVLPPPNDPPIARITIENTVMFLDLQTVITTMQDSNGSPRAVVILDGSQSSDPDGDPLSYFWFVGDQPLGSGVQITRILPPGSYDFHLLVSDGMLSNTNSAHVAILTPCDAIGLLSIRIAESTLHRSDKRPLIRALELSCEDFERGDIAEGIAGLESFQHKVQVRLGRTDPAFAALLIEAAQTLIDAITAN